MCSVCARRILALSVYQLCTAKCCPIITSFLLFDTHFQAPILIYQPFQASFILLVYQASILLDQPFQASYYCISLFRFPYYLISLFRLPIIVLAFSGSHIILLALSGFPFLISLFMLPYYFIILFRLPIIVLAFQMPILFYQPFQASFYLLACSCS